MSCFNSENLKKLMTHANISSHELARRLGVKQSILYRLISGENINPKLGTVKPLADYFNVTISQLIGESDLFQLPNNKQSNNSEHLTSVPLLTLEELKIDQKPIQDPIHLITISGCQLSKSAFACEVINNNIITTIPNNSIVLIEPMIKPTNGDYALIKNQTAFLLSKFYETKGKNKLLLHSANDFNTIETLSSEDNILGTVVKIIYSRTISF